MKKTEFYQNELLSLIKSGSKRIIVNGLSGLGKTNVIRNVCRSLENCVWIDYDFSLYATSFEETMIYKLKTHRNIINFFSKSIDSHFNNIDYVFEIIQTLNEKKISIVFSFENIINASEYAISFINRLANLDEFYPLLCIIIEEDTDVYTDKIIKLKENIVFNSISVSPFQSIELKDYICEITNCSVLRVSEIDWDHIFKSSQGTLTIMNVIINELTNLNFVNITNGIITIRDLPKKFLINGIKPFVLKRFNKLPINYQEFLKKSSCIGYSFYESDANSIFSNSIGARILQNIQDSSNLIYELENNFYQFESQEVYKTIHNLMDADYKNEIIKTCADYFFSTLNSTLKIVNPMKYMYNLSLSKELYQSINDVHKLKLCIRLLIGCKIELRLLREANDLCILYDDICTDEQEKIINNIMLLECCICLENFEYAQKIVSKIKIDNTYLKIKNYYLLALCYYGTSNGKMALNILHKCEKIMKVEYSPLLYAKIMRLLSSVYDFYSDWEKQLLYFNKSVEICKKHKLQDEFYSILRQSGMIYPYKIAMIKYKSAERYFLKQQNKLEIAKVKHNIAMDSLYMNHFSIAKSKCEESIEYFRLIGSYSISNPLNLKGILMVMNDMNLDGAIECFVKSAKLNPDKFMKCTCYLNASTAYRLKGDIVNFNNYLKKSQELNKGTMPIITIAEWISLLLFYFESNYKKDCNIILTKLDTHSEYLEYRHVYFINCIKKMLNIPYESDQITRKNKTNFINNTCTNYLNKCFELKCYWATSRFWEN
ncbi:MAG: tetratricopeptide repeat protein [Erysipelotrichales bacterium]|nr:tetratricopeptide repeat protein [Erysipelotrichales bacterium]